jgi:hypothetical protein
MRKPDPQQEGREQFAGESKALHRLIRGKR